MSILSFDQVIEIVRQQIRLQNTGRETFDPAGERVDAVTQRFDCFYDGRPMGYFLPTHSNAGRFSLQFYYDDQPEGRATVVDFGGSSGASKN